ncbi:MAG: GNAT family N-acetyltransferase, partial [Gammaproteobacteria bacterium]
MDSFAELRIDTERLLLRPLREGDAAALFAIRSDPKVMRYWSTPPWSSIETAKAR